MITVRLARMAMACRFELVLQGDDEPWLRAAGEEALREIERLEAQLSIFRTDSDVARINARAARGPVPVEPRLFRLLQDAAELSRQTDGAFDLTVAPLMEAWGFYSGSGRMPDAGELARARACTGMRFVELDEAARTIRFRRDGVRLDFGAIGKGLAIDEAVAVLREAGVDSAFLHGGTSTMYGLGKPADGEAWTVLVPNPDGGEPAAVVALADEALSVSAESGKCFIADGQVYGHVLDPRLGRPVKGAALAAAAGPSATAADALSTALLVCGRPLPSARLRSLVIHHARGGRQEIFNTGLVPGSTQQLAAS